MVDLLSVAVHTSLLIGGFFLVVYLYFKQKYKTWEKLNVPYIKPEFPFGNTPEIVSQSAGDTVKAYYQLTDGKPFVGLYSFSSPFLLVRDPELIKTIFVKEFMSFHDRGFYYNEKDDPLSAHMFSMVGSRWRKLRNKLSPTFTSGKMKVMFPVLTENSKVLVDVLKGPAARGEVIEVKDYTARYTTDVIASVAFGVQANSLRDPNAIFRVMGRKLVEPNWENMLRGTVAIFWPELAKKIRMLSVPRVVSKYFMQVFQDTLTHRQQNKVKGKDFMQSLIQLMETGNTEDGKAGDDELGKFTFNEAAAQAFIFYVGGFETSSTTMQFALYELALNQDIQDTLREEIVRVLEKHENQITYEAIYEMEYLGRVVDETLRKYPPVSVLFRQCTRTFQIPNTDVVIPSGTRVQIPIYGLQTDPKIYPNPEKFDPERFTEEEKSKRHNYTYLPFGEGPRICIGMRFGLMQTRIGLISLLTNFRFEVAETTPIPMVFDKKSGILSPEGGMNLRITKLQ